ncbi:hypothetical protein HY409_02410 [Candidatus Gottesmanbacteria bacterium]|nr:hypothetical protein [Candidatus Gottesmanbacteria bacterium]
MALTPDTRPGCGNFDSLSGVCLAGRLHREKNIPTMAIIAKISPPGAIEGPDVQIDGIICKVRNGSPDQIGCSDYVPRTEADDTRDLMLD